MKSKVVEIFLFCLFVKAVKLSNSFTYSTFACVVSIPSSNEHRLSVSPCSVGATHRDPVRGHKETANITNTEQETNCKRNKYVHGFPNARKSEARDRRTDGRTRCNA